MFSIFLRLDRVFLKDWIVLLSDVKMRRRYPESDFFRSMGRFLRFLDQCLDKAKYLVRMIKVQVSEEEYVDV